MSQMVKNEVTWADLIDPLVRRCEVASALDMTAAFNGESVTALTTLLKTMAELLDNKSTETLTFH